MMKKIIEDMENGIGKINFMLRRGSDMPKDKWNKYIGQIEVLEEAIKILNKGELPNKDYVFVLKESMLHGKDKTIGAYSSYILASEHSKTLHDVGSFEIEKVEFKEEN